jgi:gamma-glutamyltranspeptidase/glutathione hydrolase
MDIHTIYDRYYFSKTTFSLLLSFIHYELKVNGTGRCIAAILSLSPVASTVSGYTPIIAPGVLHRLFTAGFYHCVPLRTLGQYLNFPLEVYMRFSLLALALLLCCCNSTDVHIHGVIARNGMVVTAHPEATRVGVEVLRRGGTAMDAAIAVQFALAVVYPGAGNIGGGGFMVVREADGTAATLDFREKAPALATHDMFLDSSGKVIDKLSTRGHLAAGVPGVVAGMIQTYERYGTLPFATLVQPAIDLARNGFALTGMESEKLNGIRADVQQYSTSLPWIAERSGWKQGDTVVITDLARTLERIRDNGRDGFYTGATADSIVMEMQRGGGLISYTDLRNYEAVWREPVVGTYRGYKVISMAPPSSGGIALLQLLQSVESYPLKTDGWNLPRTVHIMTEAERRVYADRATHLGDPDFYTVPQEELLRHSYNTRRMSDVSLDRATPSEAIRAGVLPPRESEETTHFSIVDRWGNAVSVTTTLNSSFGSTVIVGGAGFLLNNEMDDFSAKPGAPNLYGLVGGEANAIQPGKRMLSSMTPTIVEKDGKLYMVVGTPGGSTIMTSVFQTILNVTEHGMTMQEAINAKKFHHQWLPDILFYEEGAFTHETIQTLRAMGHKLQQREPIGRVDAILVHPDGLLEGGADPRGDDTAMGVETE